MNSTALSLLASLLVLSHAPAQGPVKFKFEVETLGGRKLTQDDFKNNVLIIDFWGTWCPQCKKAIPGLVKLYGKYKHHGLEIVGLNYREKGSKDEVLATIRDFATAAKITYPLAIGTKRIKNQVIGFGGYPTMLFFKKGLKFDHLESGFDPAKVAETEQWIRKALGLDDKDGKGTAKKADKKAKAEKVEVALGAVYRPGNHDKGFEFTVSDLDGKEVKFTDYLGKRVVLALTSTWDHEAANTVIVLNQILEKWADQGVVVLAASLEMKTERVDRVSAIKAFIAKNKTKYKILPVGLKFLKKVHHPEGVPLFLVFDDKGTLILRQQSDTKAKVLKALNAALTTKV